MISSCSFQLDIKLKLTSESDVLPFAANMDSEMLCQFLCSIMMMTMCAHAAFNGALNAPVASRDGLFTRISQRNEALRSHFSVFKAAGYGF